MDQNKGKAVRLTKNLGGTGNFLGDEDGSNNQPKQSDKIEVINEEEDKKERAAKEKASVKYNYQDFLK